MNLFGGLLDSVSNYDGNVSFIFKPKKREGFSFLGGDASGGDASGNTSIQKTGNLFGSQDMSGQDLSGNIANQASKGVGNILSNQSYVQYGLHLLFSAIIVFIWGYLGTNLLYLVSLSEEDMNYYFPTDQYQQPYCYTGANQDKSVFSYGFPYDLSNRVCNTNKEIEDLIVRESRSFNILNMLREGTTTVGLSDMLYYYLYASTYGGLGRGARSFTRFILRLFSPNYRSAPKNKNSVDELLGTTFRKLFIYLILPFTLPYLVLLISAVALGGTMVFGVLNQHPFWGILLTIFVGIFLGFFNGFYTLIWNIYFFLFYPAFDMKGKATYDKIFGSMKHYLLYVFYFLAINYAFQDLNSTSAAGVVFIVLIALIFGVP